MIIGTDSSIPMVSPPTKSELRVRLPEEFADDTRKTVNRDEAAEDQARRFNAPRRIITARS